MSQEIPTNEQMEKMAMEMVQLEAKHKEKHAGYDSYRNSPVAHPELVNVMGDNLEASCQMIQLARQLFRSYVFNTVGSRLEPYVDECRDVIVKQFEEIKDEIRPFMHGALDMDDLKIQP